MSSAYIYDRRSVQGGSYAAASGSVRFPDHLINEPKLRPRLAAIYNVEEKALQCTWSRGQYRVKADKEIFVLSDVGPGLGGALCTNECIETAGTSSSLTMMCQLRSGKIQLRLHGTVCWKECLSASKKTLLADKAPESLRSGHTTYAKYNVCHYAELVFEIYSSSISQFLA